MGFKMARSTRQSPEARVADVLTGWQDRLLQLDRRNGLLNFRPRTTAVKIVDWLPNKIFASLSGNTAGLRFDYAEPPVSRNRGLMEEYGVDEAEVEDPPVFVPGDLSSDGTPVELQRRLRNLMRRTNEFREEQGLSVLYLALGLLEWVDTDGRVLTSPLLLLPCELERASPRSPFTLRCADDDLAANATLAAKLRNDFGIELPELDLDTATPGECLDAYRDAFRERRDWTVSNDLHLSIFAYSKLAMWRDLEELKEDPTGHGMVAMLAGVELPEFTQNKDTLPKLPTEKELEGAGLDDLLGVREQFAVLPADYSQMLAVKAAMDGHDLVIYGPPGTGKSQTIANIVATGLARGKSILFVSEKNAALDVVKDRLEESNLGVFCLDLHGDRGGKANFYRQLRQAVDDPRVVRRAGFAYEELEQTRGKLNDYVRALHAIRQPLGMNAFDVQGKLSWVRESPHVPFPIDNLESLDRQRLTAVLEAANRIRIREKEFREHSTSIWRILKTSSPTFELADRVRADMRALVDAFEDVRRDAAPVAARLGLIEPRTLGEVDLQLRITRHLATGPGVPAEWLASGETERLEAVVDGEQKAQSERRELLAEVAPYFGDPPTDIDFAGSSVELQKVMAQRQYLDQLLSPDWTQRILNSDRPVSASLEEIEGAVSRLIATGADTAEFMSLTEPVSWADAEWLKGRAERMSALTPIPAHWLTRVQREAATGHILAAQSVAGRIKAAGEKFFSRFDRAVVDAIDPEMARRFRTDHQSWWKRMLPGRYRSDRRVVRAHRRVSESMTFRQELDVVNEIMELKGLQDQWAEQGPQLAEVMGDRYRGQESNWEAVLAEISEVDEFFNAETVDPGVIQRTGSILTDEHLANQMVTSAGSLKRVVEEAAASFSIHLGATMQQDVFGGNMRLATLRELAGQTRQIASGIENVISMALWQGARSMESVEALPDLLIKAARLRTLETECAARESAVQQDFGERYAGFDTDWVAVRADLDWVGELVATASSIDFSPTFAGHVEEPEDSTVYRRLAEPVGRALETARGRLEQLQDRYDLTYGPFTSWADADFAEILAWAQRLDDEADWAGDWLTYSVAASDVDRHLGPVAMDEIRKATEDCSAVPAIVERRIWTAWLDWLYASTPQLAYFDAHEQVDLVDRFKALDGQMVETAENEIRRKVFQSYPDTTVSISGANDLAVLRRELSKRRRQWSVRRTLDAIPRLVQALKPCFLVSPLAVSQYLPLELDFDIVVFDEASQVFPEDAIPAIRRGKQVIFAGDQKQLPPSNFFRAHSQDDDNYNDDDDEPEDTLAGYESILDVAVGLVGAAFTETHLNVHYRSRDESLIRFSNHYFYEDRLLTFPSPASVNGDSWDGMHDIYLPDGRYDAGATRTNREEAERVVDLVFEHMRTRPAEESVGVVALSRAQADHIDRLIEHRRLEQADVDHRFVDATNEPFFVKNLENVQGDERDRIIISVGYGPTRESGATPNRFGPLNVTGGERRLNVLVTRAKHRIDLVHSLRAQEITSERDGPRLLKRYLEYAEAPHRALEGQTTVDPDAISESPFEESLARALLAKGYKIARQVGVAGYRIDLAIEAEDSGGYDLGIECDGWRYHSAPAARDRDWQRQQVLEGLGWRIHRVWSTAWAKNPGAEMERIDRALRVARSETSKRPRTTGRRKPKTRAPELEKVEPATARVELAEYQMAKLPRPSRITTYSHGRFRGLEERIIKVVQVEGPVHREVVLNRLRECYYPDRFTRRVKREVAFLIDEEVQNGTIQGSGDFLWMDSDQLAQGPRTLGDRTIDQIPPAELGPVVIDAANALFGSPRSELAKEVARKYGFARTGTKIASAIDASVQHLLDSGQLVEEFGKVRVGG